MSKLALFGRPYVVFDVNNIDHRRWFTEFATTASWKNCPVRVVVEGQGLGNMVSIMQNQLIEYYGKQEFSKNT